jgi:hypothetical protein
MRIPCCLAFVASCVSAAVAAPAPPPEIQRTVEAFAGEWSLQTTMTPPGAPPATFAERVVCKKAVMGRAVSCVDTAAVPGMGAVESAYLIGYDAETKAVHLFAMGSPGEVHDHKCVWKDAKALDCEPYKGTAEGSPITETVSFIFDGNNIRLKATTVTKDGTVAVEATGKRAAQ